MKFKVNIRNDLRREDLKEIGDLHESIYSKEHGFNEEFAVYVKETLSEFNRPQTDRERIWIVEKDARIMGCLAVVEHSENVAQVRWFLVHPELRGFGIGSRMFGEAVEFIEKCGYSSAFLFTQSILGNAARIYERFGFELVEENVDETWGQKLVSQKYTWKR